MRTRTRGFGRERRKSKKVEKKGANEIQMGFDISLRGVSGRRVDLIAKRDGGTQIMPSRKIRRVVLVSSR